MSPEMKNNLDMVLSSITKAYGKGAVMKLTETPEVDPDNTISSGSIALDSALGIGGYRKGRIVEIYGPESSGKTTLALHGIASAQRQDKVCAFIDTEHALDPPYASRLGVNLDTLLVSQPNFAEQALEITDMLARSGEVGLIVIDSVAALIPQAELEGNMGDSLPGLQARLMSQAMRKLTAVVHNTGCTLIFINQIRYKIGVMFGCFHYDTLVNFTDGRSLPIGKVVDEQIKGNVYCFNPDTEEIETKPITDWHDNGKVTNQDEFIHIQTESIDGRGRFGFTCTPNHKVLTDKGWKEACVLSYQDKLISKYTETVNGKYEDFIRGCLIGDSHISLRTTNTASLRLQNNENTEYMNWKLDKLTPFINFTERSIPKRGYRYDSDYSYEWAKIKRDLGNRDPLYMLSYYSHLGMALWIMDDGHLDLQNSHCRYIISMKRYRNNQDKLREITERLKQLGFHCNYNNRDGSIAFGKDVSMSIAAHIKKYVPECMQYKLPEELRGDYEKFELFNHPKLQIDTVCIKEIRPASSRQMRNKRKFDISVEGNHNYMVGGKHNGVIVHNSPETTSGGNALKFYASQRLDIRRIGSIKNKEAIIGNRTKVKIVKNKLAPPFKIAEFDIRFGIGIDRAGEVIDLGIEDGIVKKSGSWFSLSDGTKVGQGRDNAVQFMKDNPKITKKIRKELLENRGLDDSSPEEKTDGQTDEAEEVQGNTSGPAVDIHG